MRAVRSAKNCDEEGAPFAKVVRALIVADLRLQTIVTVWCRFL